MPQITQTDLNENNDGHYRLWQFPNCTASLDGKYCKLMSEAICGLKQYFLSILEGVANAIKQNYFIDF